MEIKNIHFNINGTEVCFTELVKALIDFVMSIIKVEFPELNEITE